MLERRKESNHKLHLGSTHKPFPRLPVLRMCFLLLLLLLLMHLRQMLRCSPTLSLFNFSPPHTTSQNSSDVCMINNMEISNSPSLKLTGEPNIIIDTHHSEESDLLEYQSFISSMVVDTILENQNAIIQHPSTDKNINNYLSIDG